ncbi:hypothetical protein NZ698_07925 [Chryseobacterium sp. PBS4-4]|uniref:Uncharacterized protein n=1 Tax=Chryseobacterium edaphi TaxID=2976532 RepID=A0ABT2W4H5_9FLAO|nr:hypothetical protein [Chryseobacterium edaphi]MCU7617122.1 hypothetical protein [Chryseobacterium edaphi]
MIKKIILCATLVPILSFANVIKDNSISDVPKEIKNNREKKVQEKVPKTVIIKTKKFKIRIDKQPNGNYLYQSWGANTKITAKPSMIISDGELIPDGSGGNYYYEFNNNNYSYKVYRNYLTNSATKPAYTLVVTDIEGKTFVRQDGKVVKN